MIKFRDLLREMKPRPGGRPMLRKMVANGMPHDKYYFIEPEGITGQNLYVQKDADFNRNDLILFVSMGGDDSRKIINYLESRNIPFEGILNLYAVHNASNYFTFEQ